MPNGRSYRSVIILGYGLLAVLLFMSLSGGAFIYQQVSNARASELQALLKWHGVLYWPFVALTLFFYWRCSRIGTPWYHGITWFILIGGLAIPPVQSLLFHRLDFNAPISFDELLITSMHYLVFPLMVGGLIYVEIVRLRRRF